MHEADQLTKSLADTMAELNYQIAQNYQTQILQQAVQATCCSMEEMRLYADNQLCVTVMPSYIRYDPQTRMYSVPCETLQNAYPRPRHRSAKDTDKEERRYGKLLTWI